MLLFPFFLGGGGVRVLLHCLRYKGRACLNVFVHLSSHLAICERHTVHRLAACRCLCPMLLKKLQPHRHLTCLPPPPPTHTPAAFLAGVTRKGELLRAGLTAAFAGNPHLVEVRGVGLICGVQLDTDAGKLVAACRERGLIVITAGGGRVGGWAGVGWMRGRGWVGGCGGWRLIIAVRMFWGGGRDKAGG
jgi:hypothetical protein